MLKERGVSQWIALLQSHEVFVCNKTDDLETEIVQIDTAGGTDIGCALWNRWIATAEIEPDARYLMLCDDDWLPEGFIEALNEVPADAPLIVTSMKRGQHAKHHPAWTLIADPEAMRYGVVGFEQGIYLGSTLLEYRASTAIDIRQVNEKVLIDIAQRVNGVYLRDLHIWFNYLEPGRWDNVEPDTLVPIALTPPHVEALEIVQAMIQAPRRRHQIVFSA